MARREGHFYGMSALAFVRHKKALTTFPTSTPPVTALTHFANSAARGLLPGAYWNRSDTSSAVDRFISHFHRTNSCAPEPPII